MMFTESKGVGAAHKSDGQVAFFTEFKAQQILLELRFGIGGREFSTA